MSFRPDAILAVLARRRVTCVIIGGLAATLYGAGTVTFDVDIVPEPSPENLARLSAALDELDARIRVAGIPDGLPFDRDATALAAFEALNLVTVFGDLDVAFHPSGIPEFSDWDRGAETREALGVSFRLASLRDIIRSKQAAGRPKDRATLPALRVLLARRSSGG